jgi:hypothetical protein
MLAACEPASIPVAGPFYLTYFENPREMALFRCPGPGSGCAIDGLPGPTVYAAGADQKYIVVASHPFSNGQIKRSIVQYFYFARIKTERQGWGNDPEHIIGPLSEQQFNAARKKYGLPDFSIVLDDLK